MDFERERRFQELLVGALELAPEERRARLRELAPDAPDLVDEVLAAVDEEDALGAFLEVPAALDPSSAGSNTGGPSSDPDSDGPDTLGPYRILGELGRGGMGTVYLAEQREPVERRVALKVIGSRFVDRQLRIRFLAERQALARLSHPHVAQLHEAGNADDGSPWFAMELVEGAPLTEHADEQRLGFRDRIELFLQVCDGVAHAHRKGVLHRDLKPSNLLVAGGGDRPRVKVIDFGIARTLDRPLVEATLATGARLLGTPAYMSPEAVQDADRVDTRSDVYSLGVILYELLVGVRPLDDRDQDPLWLLSRIVREEPVRPSTRWTGLDDDTRSAIAERRDLDPREVRRALSGDLEWIVMRAIDREPERRYASVQAFADDLERHLRGDPVEARPPSPGYRLGKLVRRHRIAVAAVLVALLGLLAGVAGLGVGLVRSRAEAESARQALQESREVSGFLVDLFRHADPTATSQGELTVRELVERGAEQIPERLADQPAARARLLHTLGEVMVEMGRFDEAEPMLREAATLAQEVFPEKDPTRSSLQRSLGVLAFQRGEWARAESAFRQAVEELDPEVDAETWSLARHNLGVAVYRQRRFDEAEAHFLAALEVRRQGLEPDHPHLARSFNALGALLVSRERPADAIPHLAASLAHRERNLGPDHPDLAKSLVNLALAEMKLGRFATALPRLERALAIEEASLGSQHPDIATTLANLADLRLETNEDAEAEVALRRMVAIHQQAFGEGRRLYRSLVRLADLLVEHDRLDEAAALYHQAAAALAPLDPDDPARTVPRAGLAGVAWRRGDLLRAGSEAEAVLAELEEVKGPADYSLLRPLRILAGVAAAEGDIDRAAARYERSLAIWSEAEPVEGRAERTLRGEYLELLRAAGRDAEVARVRAGSRRAG